MKHTSLIPALVISIGSFAQKIAQQTAKIYLASDPDREDVTQFITLGEGDKSNFDLLPLPLSKDESSRVILPKSGSAGERQAFIEKLVKSADQIRATMANVVHRLHAHEDLIKIDLDQRLEKSVNQFIIADLTDPIAAAALLPLSFLLQDINNLHSNTHSQLVLNTAILPNENGLDYEVEAALFHRLQELDQVLTSISNQKHLDLLKAMGIREKNPLSIPIYLFDYRKPNYNNVKDRDELQRIISNSLISLMSGNLTDTIYHNRPSGYIQKAHAFYQSIGAANLIYDPDSLIEACSSLFAYRVIEKGIQSPNQINSVISNLLNQVSQQMGATRDWYSFLLSGTHYNLALDEDKKPSIAEKLPGFTFKPINYEHVHETSWVKDIKDYISQFKNEDLPKTIQNFGERTTLLEEQNLNQMICMLEEQIENPALYPDAINAIRQILHQIEENFDYRKKDLTKQLKKIKPKTNPVKLDGKLNKIQSIISEAPKLPRWWKFVPTFLRRYLSLLINIFWIIRHHFKLKRIKNQITADLAAHHAALIETNLIEKLLSLINNFHEKRKAFLNKISVFEKTINQTKSHFPDSWESIQFPLGQDEMHWDDTFRSPAVNRDYAVWVYEKYEPNPTSAASKYIKENQLFMGWQSLDPITLQQRLIQACQRNFKQLERITLNEVLETRYRLLKNSAGDPDNVNFDPVSPLLRAALPLMRPNFDALGGSGYSTKKIYMQAKDKESRFLDPVLNNNDNIHFIQVDDPYIISAISIQDLMPLAAFTALNEHLKEAYERLSTRQKKKLVNVFVPIPRLEGEDLEEKIFTWEFGEPVETLEIALPISHKRFRHAQQEQRLPINEWVHYVISESPELNYLAACFLNIFLKHPEWNGYEQTSAILAFVQQGITYAYDEDTTPQTEWPRYPIETLKEGVGDCEDVAILTAAILSRLGFQVSLLNLPGHFALGIAGVDNFPGDYVMDPRSGRHYYYAEATGNGWQIGVIPENHKKQNVEIYPVERLIEK